MTSLLLFLLLITILLLIGFLVIFMVTLSKIFGILSRIFSIVEVGDLGAKFLSGLRRIFYV